jgi:hypothetical protein
MDSFSDQMKTGDKVRLVSFNNSVGGPVELTEDEDYWRLLGKDGVVVSTIPPSGIKSNRVLIKFNEDIREIGLACHNQIENALWIKRSDLALL